MIGVDEYSNNISIWDIADAVDYFKERNDIK